MALSKAQIHELQEHFNSRVLLLEVKLAMKCYPEKSSIFFSFTNGWGKKQYLNIPIKHEDIIPIINKYIGEIDSEIIRLTTESHPKNLKIHIQYEDNLVSAINDYKSRYPETYTNYESIVKRLKESYLGRLSGKDTSEVSDDYHVEVCSDWQDKIYVFSFAGAVDDTIYFAFKEIYKL